MNANRRHISHLILLMISITFIINTFAFGFLYLRVFEQNRIRLIEIARVHIALIGTILQNSFKTSPQELFLEFAVKRLDKIREVHKEFNDLRQGIEFFIVRKEQDQVHFLISHRHDGQPSNPISLEHNAALPMKLALSNQSGNLIMLDEWNEKYLVAYEPIPQLQMGVVVRIRLKEIQEPFFFVGLISFLVALLLLLISIFIVRRISNPIMDHMEVKENQLQAVLDTAADGIITINETGKIEGFNLAAEKMFGYLPSEILGKNIKILMPEPYSTEHDHYLQHFMQTGEKRIIGSVREVFAQKKSQEVFPIELSVSEVCTPSKTRQFCGIIRDITKRKQAEQELKNTQNQLIQSAKLASLGEMATGIAHELNQPLASISMNAEIILEEIQVKRDATSEESCQVILEQVERASNIINHLKTFGRKTSLTDQKEQDLNSIIYNVFSFLQEQFHLRDIQFIKELDTNSLFCKCNKIQLEQVLINLLVNARDAVENQSEKKIWVRSFSTGEWNIIEVKDNGSGISPKNQKSLFEPFFTTKDIGKGTGLGLSISYGIIKNHQGQIEFESKEGEGTLFRLKLPISKDPS